MESNDNVDTQETPTKAKVRVKSKPIPQASDSFLIQPPSPKSKQFQDVASMFTTMPEANRKELAKHYRI